MLFASVSEGLNILRKNIVQLWAGWWATVKCARGKKGNRRLEVLDWLAVDRSLDSAFIKHRPLLFGCLS